MASDDPAGIRHGHYRVERLLGTGGMAKVYLAIDERLQRPVALKVLPGRLDDAIATEARFLREARAAAQLDHPNVCAIYEVGQTPEGHFIAMQLVEGETLAARLQRRRLTLREAADIAIQVLDALAEAHGKGIVHRDIKPANIMLTPKEQVKVLDFGLALTSAPGTDPSLLGLTQSGMVVGTVPYMSPEQLRGETTTPRSDLFSVGTMLYEMATGHRPFQAGSGVEVMSAILREVPPLLADERAASSGGVSPALRRILRHALEKDPARRFASAAEFRGELEVLREGLSGSNDQTRAEQRAVLSGLSETLRNSSAIVRRHQGLRWSLTTLTFVAALAGGWLGWSRIFPASSIESVAVLPILNQSGDPDLDWMCEGLGEQLTQQISRLPKLKVIARSSTLRYRGQDLDLAAVGRDLGVKALLVGRLQKHRDAASLSFELVQAADRRFLWGHRIDRPADHLVETQNTLAEEVGGALSGRLGPEERQALAGGRVKATAEAYQLYLKGRHYADKWTPEDLGRAMAYFEQAAEKDPAFALVHVGLANAWWGMASTFKPSGEVMPKVKAEAQKALALDANLAEAHTALGIATFILDRDHPTAEASLLRGIALNPSSSSAHGQYGYFLTLHARKAEAFRELDRAVELDPRSSTYLIIRAISGTFLTEPERALQDAQRALQLEPEAWFAWMVIAMNEFQKGKVAEALRDIDKATASGSSHALACKGYFLGRSGRKDDAARVLATLEEMRQSRKGFVSPTNLAYVQLGLGQEAEALKNLQLSETLREESAVGMKVDPFLSSLRAKPEFRSLLEKIRMSP